MVSANVSLFFVQTSVCWYLLTKYCKISNIRCTLVGNKIVDHSDVVGASPVGAAPTTQLYIFILELTPAFNGFSKDNCKMRLETNLWFGTLILGIWR